MGTAHEDWIAALSDEVRGGEFVPYHTYGAEEDALTVYVSGEDCYAERFGKRVTVFFSMDGKELVGCQIKCVRSVLRDIGWFDVSLAHGKTRLDLLIVALHGEFDDTEHARSVYRDLGAQVARQKIEIEIPSDHACAV